MKKAIIAWSAFITALIGCANDYSGYVSHESLYDTQGQTLGTNGDSHE